MAKLPEEGRFEYGRMDKTTGAQWVYVTPEMARGHPKGRLGATLWAIVAVFAAFGVLRIYAFVQTGNTILLVVALLQILTALMLAIRAPWAVGLAGVQMVLSLLGTITGDALRELAYLDQAEAFLTLGNLIFSGLTLFYLFEGDRPNLIYRHRFRSFRGQPED